MSNSEIPAAPPQEPDSAPEPAPEMEAERQEKHSQEPSNNISSLTFSIWPPTQRTRDAVVNRLVETLSTVSVLSKRYGTLPQDEASVAARLIEEEAFAAAAGGSFSAEDDGIEILQVYSREISRRMLDTVKNRAASGSAADTTMPLTASPSVAPATTTTTVSEDDSSAVTDS
ncbi:MFP1 attachment factor 1-like [Alnus glutinosa]|uniref:MFP1 attachment factor 1-like n=1 Tax=Alnus glutinosa TaxID=3517 RepID=UPI002D791AA2|nr:MFP1 attachment factor 1-like [Alnus glutinosa]